MSNKHTRETGRVVHWNERGFFFIQQVAEGREYFAHVADWVEDDADPHPGERVTFVVSSGRDGRPVAKSIMRATI
jgi:cold shock CspA family protein